MDNKQQSTSVTVRKSHTSKAGYVFHEDDSHWKLDKNNTVAVSAVRELLDNKIEAGFVMALVFFASNLSAAYTRLISESFLRMLRSTDASAITETMLINYRGDLTPDTEWNLGIIRAFLKKWNELGYIGVSDEVIEMLDGWTIKGNTKGDVVKRLDPTNGPLSDLELQGFNEGVVQGFEKNTITLSDLSISLSMSSTGRRPIQISHLKIKDVIEGKNKKEEPCYLLNIPRAKQRATSFREQFKQFAITHELWTILNAQASIVAHNVSQLVGFELQEADRDELPLFPDMDAISNVASPRELRDLLKSDRLHISADDVTATIRRCAKAINILSERTGKPLNVTSVRFRYTTGTRAAREGFGTMVIAELLDHSDNQNAGVYIENIPEIVAKLDQSLGHQLAHYAQAFAGVLVNSEHDALRGNDLSSRIKSNGMAIGTCGSHGFCGANVPIPCYTCMHFQPWIDGPHQIVYEELIAERERLLKLTDDLQIAAVNDRSIVAVANVIQLCAKRREALTNG